MNCLQICVICFIGTYLFAPGASFAESLITPVILPVPDRIGSMPLETTLQLRRSVRSFKDDNLTLLQVSQLLWAGQGITAANGYRTAPSAGALYPLHLIIIAGKIDNVPAGAYSYDPQKHSLLLIKSGDLRPEIVDKGETQQFVKDAPLIIIVLADYTKITQVYRDRAKRYTHMEVGHVCQNISLQAVALELGAVVIGAFYETKVKQVLDAVYEPLIVMPVGKVK